MPTLTTFTPHSFGSPSHSNHRKKKKKKKKREIKAIQIGKEEVKVSLFADDMIPFIEHPKTLPENDELINKFGNVRDTELIHRNLLH